MDEGMAPLGILPETLRVLFVIFPSDITRMCVTRKAGF